MREIDSIVLHHTACENSFETIAHYHIKVRGWAEVFYHYIIDKDGLMHKGRALDNFATTRRRGAIEIAIVGRLHEREIFDHQVYTLLNLLDELYTLLDDKKIKIFGHNELSATICPGNLCVDYFRDYYNKISSDTTIKTWKDDIMKEGVINGLITHGKHRPEEVAEKWFVVELCNRLVNRLKEERKC